MSNRSPLGPVRLLSAAVICCNLACGTTRERSDGEGQSRDAGAQIQDTGVGSTLDPNLRTYGSGDYAILLSDPNPRRYCWYTEETLRICMGSPPTQDHAYNDICYDDETNCLARQPEDQEIDTGTCWTRIDVENVSGGALYGTCDRVDAYFRRDPGTQCLYHGHCPTGRLCTDYQCVCPPGAECGCFECGPPPPPTCDGNVLVTRTPGQGCDENDRCWFEEHRTDCGANAGSCDPIRGTCEGGLGVDAGGGGGGPDAGPGPIDSGSGGGGGGGPDAGPGGPDAGGGGGGGGGPDAGCQCPPLAPASCVGDTRVELVCDPSTCVVRSEAVDCTATHEICDPTTAQCAPDVECRQDSDCPGPGPLPPGTCQRPLCDQNVCTLVSC